MGQIDAFWVIYYLPSIHARTGCELVRQIPEGGDVKIDRAHTVKARSWLTNNKIMRLHLRPPRDWSSWPWVPWNFSPKWKLLHRTLASHVNFCVFFSTEWNHLLVSWWRNALANSGFSDAHFSAVFSCSQSLSLICRCNARTKSSSDSPSAELSIASAFWLIRPHVESVFCGFPSFFAAISERTLLTVFCILLSPRTKRVKER